MRWTLAMLAALLLGGSLAQAGVFDRKKTPPPAAPHGEALQKAAERVYKLMGTLQNDTSADRRGNAAEDLSDFDGQAFPEIAPTLIQAVQKDSSSSVRREAVKALGRLRPTTPEAAQALEQATKDESYLVRFQARTSKFGYRVSEPAPPPPSPPPHGGQVIKVPPAGPDGRLTPVPIPPPGAEAPEEKLAPVPDMRPMSPPPMPPPPMVQGPRRGKVTIERPPSKPKEGDGPILVPPMR